MNRKRSHTSGRAWLLCALGLGLLLVSCGEDASGPEPCTGTCLVVSNVSDLRIEEVDFSLCSASDWGPNKLGTDEIGPGNSREWEVSPGCYDIRAIAKDGDGWCSNAEFGTQISDGERHVMQYDGCPLGPPSP